MRLTTFAPRRSVFTHTETSDITFVCLHGMWGNRLQWQNWTDPRHSDILPIDLPGHGNDHTDLKLVSTQLCVERVIDRLERIDGQIILIGHSFGALVAQKIASDRPDLVSGLVLLASSPPAGIRLPIQLKFIRYVRQILFGKVVDLIDNDKQFVLGRTQTDLGPESGTVIREVLLGKCRVRPAECPTLVVAGKRDRLLPIRTQLKIADLHHADFAAEDVGHMMHIDPIVGRHIRKQVFRWCHNHLGTHHDRGYN